MPSNLLTVHHTFGGGWAPDFGPSVDLGPSQSGELVIPYLLEAENNRYSLDGGPVKIGGADKLNAAVMESGAAIRGLFDFWRLGTSASPTQKRIVHVGTKILKDAADGTFTDLFTGLTSNSIPSYSVFGDALILSQTGNDVPRWYDNTTAQNLAGSPPNFAFSTAHKNRVWAAGVTDNPSRLYYCALLDEEDWTGAGSGFIDIEPDDGDRITGLISDQNDLFVFKGPHVGSIHRITGSSPTGSDGFSRVTYVRGIGAVGQNTIFAFRDDVGFMASGGSIHSLRATAAFGDFKESALSFPINDWLQEHLDHTTLDQCWAAVDENLGIVRLTIPIDGANTPNAMIQMDYRRTTRDGSVDPMKPNKRW